MQSSSKDLSLCTSPIHSNPSQNWESLPLRELTVANHQNIKAHIAESTRSDDPLQPELKPSDIYLY